MSKILNDHIDRIIDEIQSLYLWALTLHAAVALIPGRFTWSNRD